MVHNAKPVTLKTLDEILSVLFVFIVTGIRVNANPVA